MSQQQANCQTSLKMSDQTIDCEDLSFESFFLDEELDQEESANDEYFDNLIKDVFKEKSTTDHKKTKRITKKEKITNQTKTNINMINIPSQYPKKQSNEEQIYYNMNLYQFVQYLSLKILTDKYLNVTKNTLIYLYKLFQNEFKFMSTLERDDKRNKKKIYKKLHAYSNQIIYCLETNPIKYLKPVILYSNYQKNFHISHIKRVNYLKKMLKME